MIRSDRIGLLADNPSTRPRAALTAGPREPISASGTPLPNEGRLSGRIDHDGDKARRAAGHPALFVRPLRQAPRLEPASPHRRGSRTLAPIQDRQGEAQARHRSDPRNARSPRRLSHRHRAGFRYRRGGDGAVVAAGRAARDHARLGILRRRLGDRRREATEAQRRHGAQGALWRTARSIENRFFQRRGVHLERHHLRRARAERRLDRRRPRRPHHLRRHLGGIRAAARLAQARCRHLLLAEGARRRGRARHAHPLARARWRGWKATSRPGRCRRFSA